MNAVILAAGIGSRLRPITDTVPKCLVKVSGIPILQYQIEAYTKAGVEKIIIVTGYLSDQVRHYLRSIAIDPSHVLLIENPDYLRTNNMYSLWLTKDWINDDLLLSNGDVIFDHQIIQAIHKADSGNYVVVDRGKYIEESMKVVVVDEYIVNISKTISPEDAYATSIDLYRLNKKATSSLFSIIEENYILKDKLNLWTEVALKDLFEYELIKPFDINQRRWIEIDTLTDLLDAEKLFKADLNE